jgi:hypothetical protein
VVTGFLLRVFLKLSISSDVGLASNSKKGLLFLRAQTHATQLSNKVFRAMLHVFARKSRFAEVSQSCCTTTHSLNCAGMRSFKKSKYSIEERGITGAIGFSGFNKLKPLVFC